MEDEKLSSMFLNNLLAEYCPGITVVGMAANEQDAIACIKAEKPDLVFMDIELQEGTGFNVLRQVCCEEMQVIFATAFEHYAIRAIRFSGIGYVQKPIDIEALQAAIAQAIVRMETKTGAIAIDHLLQTIDNNFVPVRMPLQLQDGNEYIAINDIIRIEAAQTGSSVILAGAVKKMVATPIKEYESMLGGHDFKRVHSNHLVNMKQVSRLYKAEEASLLMNDGSLVPISPKKREDICRLVD